MNLSYATAYKTSGSVKKKTSGRLGPDSRPESEIRKYIFKIKKLILTSRKSSPYPRFRQFSRYRLSKLQQNCKILWPRQPRRTMQVILEERNPSLLILDRPSLVTTSEQ
jgi:hypothetical protein